MNKKIIYGALVLCLIASFLLASCTKTTTTTTTSSIVPPVQSTMAVPTVSTSTPTVSTTGNWWDILGVPQYGGSLNLQAGGDITLDVGSFDPYDLFSAGPTPQYETLFGYDLTVDHNIWAFRASWCPSQYYRGVLAESWAQTDPTTYTVKIRQGIHWQNKSPVNGRELTANDVQFTYDRLLGTGNGFTQPNQLFVMMNPNLEQVTATDKYTDVFKFKTASLFDIDLIMSSASIVAPEWVALDGPPTTTSAAAGGGPPGGGPPGGGPPGGGISTSGPTADWKNALGTGPYMPTGFVQDSTLTFAKNPDYWCYDERHPQNKLPYIDTIKYTQITDTETALAALRTDKIDEFNNMRGGMNVAQAANLKQTAPQLQFFNNIGPGSTLDMRCDTAPFTDIKVREALEMAINRPLIAQSHFGGLIDGTPCGTQSPMLTGWVTLYKDWPADVQALYTYNPTQAKQLLTEAGYPNGFKTDVVAASSDDVTLLQIYKSEFADIGVDMTINPMDQMTYGNFTGAGKEDQMTLTNATGRSDGPTGIQRYWSKNTQRNYTFNNDPYYDGLYQQLLETNDWNKAQQIVKEADMYAIKQCWSVQGVLVPTPIAWQPWVKGFDGEVSPNLFYLMTRWWIDQSLKTSMGH